MENRLTPAVPEMVADINSALLGSSPQDFFQVGASLFFTANDGIHGRELWLTDGTGSGTVLVKDIQPSLDSVLNGSSYPSSLTNVNGTLYFRANDGTSGTELWRSDGTSAGTVLVRDIRPGIEGAIPVRSAPWRLMNVSGSLFFIANDGSNGLELWRSDGTSTGTVLVKDIRPGSEGSIPDPSAFLYSSDGLLTNFNGTLFFAANDGSNGTELWRSNGTSTGTLLVKDIRPGNGGSFREPSAGGYAAPESLSQANGTLFFMANDGTSGHELWRSNGTDTGTVLVKDIKPGSEGSGPGPLTEVSGTLFFSANDDPDDDHYLHGRELWRTDGTSTGTILVKDIVPGGGIFKDSNPSHLTNLNGTLLFQAKSELWRSDGTTTGTVRVKDINPGANDYVRNLTDVNGTLFFKAIDGTHGLELWRSDGTSTGTVLVMDLVPGSIPSYPAEFVDFHTTLFFIANDGTGWDLWRSNGTDTSTFRVKKLNSFTHGSSPFGSTNVSGTLFFSAEDGTNGRELWRSDGTAAGTFLVKDIWSGDFGPFAKSSSPNSLTNVNGTLFFAANDGSHGQELWRSDGTDTGTVQVTDINLTGESVFNYSLANINGTLFFSATDSSGSFGLWRSDGAATGTTKVKAVLLSNEGPHVRPMANLNGTLFFIGDDGSSGYELWRSDGTETGTFQVKDIRPGSAGSSLALLTNVNGTLFFRANDGTSGSELWRSNGTQAGTIRVKDIYPGGSPSDPDYLTNVNGTLFFRAADSSSGFELWRSNGTAASTARVKDIYPGSNSSVPRELTNVSGTLFFTAAADSSSGFELWRSNGTAAGTAQVKEIWPGEYGYPQHLINLNGLLFFKATDGSSGYELWWSDGTSVGTQLVSDINLGPGNSNPDSFTTVNGALIFAADDRVHGRELTIFKAFALAAASDDTGSGMVHVYDAVSGQAILAPFSPYDVPDYSGGARVAMADVTGDGIPDLITAPGKGLPGGALVKVYDGAILLTGTAVGADLFSFYPYGTEYTGAVFVAAGDFNHDGKADIVTGNVPVRGPVVRVFDGDNPATELVGFVFRPFGKLYRGGVRIAVGDVNGDGTPDVIAAPSKNGSLVKAFSGAKLVLGTSKVVMQKAVSPTPIKGGVFVAAGNFNGNGRIDIIVGLGAGSRSVVYVFEDASNKNTTAKQLRKSAVNYGPSKAGVRVAVADLTGDGIVEVLTTAGAGLSLYRLRVLEGLSLALLDTLFTQASEFAEGRFVAAAP